jgi:uncharacterized protein YbcI
VSYSSLVLKRYQEKRIKKITLRVISIVLSFRNEYNVIVRSLRAPSLVQYKWRHIVSLAFTGWIFYYNAKVIHRVGIVSFSLIDVRGIATHSSQDNIMSPVCITSLSQDGIVQQANGDNMIQRNKTNHLRQSQVRQTEEIQIHLVGLDKQVLHSDLVTGKGLDIIVQTIVFSIDSQCLGTQQIGSGYTFIIQTYGIQQEKQVNGPNGLRPQGIQHPLTFLSTVGVPVIS